MARTATSAALLHRKRAAWLTEFHIDALRLDAVHAIFDHSARPFLAGTRRSRPRARSSSRTAASRHRRKRSERLPPGRSARTGRLWSGCAMERRLSSLAAHAPHRRGRGYYQDFGESGTSGQSLRDGFVYSGQYSAFRGRPPRHLLADIRRAAVRGLRSESRPGWQPHARRTTDRAGPIRTAEAGGGRGVAVALFAAAVHGRGVWRDARRSCTLSATATPI